MTGRTVLPDPSYPYLTRHRPTPRMVSIPNMRVPIGPIRKAGSWGIIPEVGGEPLPLFIVILINNRENETVSYTPCISGSQLGKSEEPEVGSIIPEVGGEPLPILLLFLYIYWRT